jgi:hypothetical protein
VSMLTRWEVTIEHIPADGLAAQGQGGDSLSAISAMPTNDVKKWSQLVGCKCLIALQDINVSVSAQATKSGLEVPITGAICKPYPSPYDFTVLSVPQCWGADPRALLSQSKQVECDTQQCRVTEQHKFCSYTQREHNW